MQIEGKKIHEQIAGYGLMDALLDRLNRIVVGGVARSTVYKAFGQGGQTPRTKLVLKTAQEVIAEHENAVVSAVLSMEQQASA